MLRSTLSVKPEDHGRRLMDGSKEPMIFHCNHYNYWLQKNLLINPDFGMADAIGDAAAVQGHVTAKALSEKLNLQTPDAVLKAAGDQYSQHGFGILDFSGLSPQGGDVRSPTSHYGQCLASACGGDFNQEQNIFDRGYAAGAAAAAFGLPVGSFRAVSKACHSLGASEGRFALERQDVVEGFFQACGEGRGAAGDATPPGPWSHTSVNEPEIQKALSGLDFSGNEEGLIPRFGVMLTDHFANFYNRISFHFLQVLEDTGMRELAEELLVEAGHRCAFNTFGGIMVSAEWDAVIRPMCRTPEDWVHGIVAVVNTFGWGTWRVCELSSDHLVLRIYDDYESRGYLGMYGVANHPVCFLASGGAAGVMNLVYTGDIASGPVLDNAFYLRIFEASNRYTARQVLCMAMGAPYTEIHVERV